MILSLLIAMSAFFIVLWVADLFFTVKSSKILGTDVEINPVMKLLLKTRKRFLWLFKAGELIAFLALVYFFSFMSAEHAFYVLLVMLVFYSVVVAQGAAIYVKASNNTAPVALLILIVCVTAIVFIYLNYATFANSVALSNSLNKCGSEYAGLYWNCTGKQAALNLPSTVNDFGLNLTIPR